jgi:Tol biopolymer transport system component
MSECVMSRRVRSAPAMTVWLVAALLVTGCSVTSARAPGAGPDSSSNRTTADTASATIADSTTVRPGAPWIVHQEYDGQQVRLWLVRPDGTGNHELLPTFAGEAVHPDWSPDGRRVAFVSENDVYVVDANGGHLRRVFDCRGACVFADYPAWSPTGREILVMSADQVKGLVPHSVVQAVDLSNRRRRVLFTTDGPEYASYPRWSPDGDSVVTGLQTFATTQPDDCTPTSTVIAVVNLRGVHPVLKRLTSPTMFADYPDWSPDGTTLVFTTYDLGSRDAHCLQDASPASDLYAIRPDGTRLTQLTHNPSGQNLVRDGTASGPLASQPTWSPDGSRIFFVRVSGETWPGWQMATIDPRNSHIRSATGRGYLQGTHPRLRPRRPANGG